MRVSAPSSVAAVHLSMWSESLKDRLLRACLVLVAVRRLELRGQKVVVAGCSFAVVVGAGIAMLGQVLQLRKWDGAVAAVGCSFEEYNFGLPEL